MHKEVVVITGASRGLGLCLAEKCIQAGKIVYGLSRSKRYWAQAKARIGNPKDFFLDRLDVSSEREVRHYLKRVFQAAGRIDILINNAGYASKLVRFESETLRTFQRNLKDNLASVFLMCKYALPFLKRQKKALIINISSMAGKRVVPNMVAYSASKFGVLALSQSIAKENPENGLKCLTVCPGGMNTEMRAQVFGRKDAEKQQTPEFVADIIMKVISDEIKVESGGDIVIRHGEVTAINPQPAA